MRNAPAVTYARNVNRGSQGRYSVVGAKPKLLDQLREGLRSRHYSRRTEQTYCLWVKRFIFGLALAMGLSPGESVEEYEERRKGPPPRPQNHTATGREGGRKGRCGQTCWMPYLPAFICHSSSGKRLRYSDDPGASGT